MGLTCIRPLNIQSRINLVSASNHFYLTKCIKASEDIIEYSQRSFHSTHPFPVGSMASVRLSLLLPRAVSTSVPKPTNAHLSTVLDSSSYEGGAPHRLSASPYLESFRTLETNPSKHSALHLSKYYVVPQDVVQSLDAHKIMRKEYSGRANSFQETALMIRPPLLETKNYLFGLTSKDSISPRILLYGVDGAGKSAIFLQNLHAAQSAGWFVVCPVRQYLWNKYFKEVAVSVHKVIRF